MKELQLKENGDLAQKLKQLKKEYNKKDKELTTQLEFNSNINQESKQLHEYYQKLKCKMWNLKQKYIGYKQRMSMSGSISK
jgi:predicted nuclease with TOPRIM domain